MQNIVNLRVTTASVPDMRFATYSKLMLLITTLVVLSLFTLPAKAQSSLKKCPADQSLKFDNCYGIYHFPEGGSYEGEWQNDKRNGRGTYKYKNGQVYVGTWLNDKRHGQGTYTFPNGEKYVGEFKDGDYHGLGTITMADGGIYIGQWVDDKKNGHGTYTFPDGDKYIGQYRNGLRNGHGTYTFANGNSYVGEFKDDAYDGIGTFTFADGGKYIGQFKDSKYHGQGILYAADGTVVESGRYEEDVLVESSLQTAVKNPKTGTESNEEPSGQTSSPFAQSTLKKCPADQSQRFHNCFGPYSYPKGGFYEGEWQNDKRNGRGVYKFENGQVYTGEWKNDKRHGQGTYTFPSGEKYVGEFQDGNYHGLGTITMPDGGVFIGHWENDKKHGQGTYTFPDGDKFAGEYKDGVRHGHGTYTFANGNSYVGEFENDAYSGSGTFTFADGRKYIGEFKNSKYNGYGTFYDVDGTIIESGRYENDVLVSTQAQGETDDNKQLTKAENDDIVDDAAPQAVGAGSQNKVALVIGNSSYVGTAQLKTPAKDAAEIADMLEKMGFTVLQGMDLNKNALELKIRNFIEKAQSADISLFYYAGHAVQVAGQNYIVPIGAKVDSAAAIDFELVNMSVVSNNMGGQDKSGIILLDASRKNPFTASLSNLLGATRATQVGNGLAPIISQNGGLLIGFAATPNDVVADGDGENSPFVTGLLKHLSTPGLEIELAMKRVKADVIRLTDNGQRPWHNSDLTKEVYLLAN